MTKRTLILRRECLAVLTAEELGEVAGGQQQTYGCPPDYTYYCITGPRICVTNLVCV
jgi:hypothetical protein